jgi:hypothetical protein
MTLRTIVATSLALLLALTSSATPVLAGAADTGALASCEMASAKGIPILASASVSVDFSTTLAAATIKTLTFKPRPRLVVLRAQVAPDIGLSPMEYICQVLNGDTAEGGDTLATQILAAAGLPGRQIMITKTSIFGCNVLPCANPGLKPDFASIPGSENTGVPTATALGDVILFAVK